MSAASARTWYGPALRTGRRSTYQTARIGPSITSPDEAKSHSSPRSVFVQHFWSLGQHRRNRLLSHPARGRSADLGGDALKSPCQDRPCAIPSLAALGTVGNQSCHRPVAVVTQSVYRHADRLVASRKTRLAIRHWRARVTFINALLRQISQLKVRMPILVATSHTGSPI